MSTFVYNVTRKEHTHTVLVPARSRKEADRKVTAMQGRKKMDIDFVRTQPSVPDTPCTCKCRVKVSTKLYTQRAGAAPTGYAHWWFRLTGGPNGGRLWTPKSRHTMEYEAALAQAIVEARATGCTTVTLLPPPRDDEE